MTTRTIPIKTVVTCDRCGIECSNKNSRHESKLTDATMGAPSQDKP